MHSGSRLTDHARPSASLSRAPETLTDVAEETGATPVTSSDAAWGNDLVIVTIPEGRVSELPADLFADTPDDVVVVDTGNYYPQRDGRVEGGSLAR